MPERPNILVVCARNKLRSRTAENIFKNDSRFNIRSAGLSQMSDKRITEKDIHWADLILVMENEHKTRIVKQYMHLELPGIEVLYIPDNYEFMDPELIEILKQKINGVLNSVFYI